MILIISEIIYSVLFLVLFRILYGFVGTKYARFSDFLYHPAKIADYLKGLLIGRPKHYIGHNPAGGFMILIMLLSLLSLTLTGLKAYVVKGHGPLANHEISFMTNAFADSDDKENHDEHDIRKRSSQKNNRTEKIEKDEFWEEVHEAVAYFTLFLVSIHSYHGGIGIKSCPPRKFDQSNDYRTQADDLI